MATENELNDYLLRGGHNLSNVAMEYIRCCWDRPSRMVGTEADGNMVSFVPSRKLDGRTYSTESRSPERAFLILCEFDDDVLFALDQPDPIQIQRTYKNGVKRWGSYTSDSLVLSKSGPRVVEVKAASDIAKYLVNNPDDWKRCESGEIVYRPAREAFAKLGLLHVVYVYNQSDRFLVDNLDLMLLARGHEEVQIVDEKRLKNVMRKAFAMTLYELWIKLKLSSMTPLIHAIDRGLLMADLKQSRLSDAKNCLVSLNADLLEHAIELHNKNKVYWDGLAGSSDLKKIPTLNSAEKAIEKLKKIDSEPSSRNIRRWKQKIKAGAESNLSEFQSLIPLDHLRGNRMRKIPTVVDELLMDYLLDTFIKRQGLSLYRGYIDYTERALRAHPQFRPVSRRTFTRRFEQIPGEVIGAARGGKRQRNAMAAPTDPLMRSLKSSIPWQRAAADHYLADIYLVLFSRTGEVYVERPWVTALVDLATSKILGLCISFCKPSRRSVAKVIRDCVRRHGKLPREIIVDRGSDFKSVYLASFMAHYGLTLSLRPSAAPKFGGEIEGFFGEFKKQWLSQRPGNLADYQEARSVDGNKAPKKAAILQPVDFYTELWSFCEWRENKTRGTGPISIDLAFHQGAEQYPFYAKQIEYDSDFITVTAVEDKKYSFTYQFHWYRAA